MHLGNIKQSDPALSVVDLFKRAVIKSSCKERVSTSTLNILIQGIKNSTQELNAKEYEVVCEHGCFLDKILQNQRSKCTDRKQNVIDHALNLAAGRLSLEARKELRNQSHGRDDINYPGEIVTDKKVLHFSDINILNAKVFAIEKSITKFRHQQRSPFDSEDVVRNNYMRYKQLQTHLKEIIREINAAHRTISSSSYQHHKDKVNILNQLYYETRDLFLSLGKMAD